MSAKFKNTKTISLLIGIVGLVAAGFYWICATENWRDHMANQRRYSIWTGKYSYENHPEILDMPLVQFAFSEHMNSMIWFLAFLILAVFVILAIFIYAFYFNQELNILETGIKGVAPFGKEHEYSFDRICAVKKNFFHGIMIVTVGQKKIKFRFIQN